MSDIAYDQDDHIEAARAHSASAESFEKIRPLPRISVQAFCETESLLKTIERCGQDRRMSKVSLRVTNGGVGAAVNMFASAPTPNLIILEVSSSSKDLMNDLAPLAEVCDPSTKVVLVGHHNDIALYRELIRNGISEYIVAPISMADVIGVIASIFVDPDAEPLGRSIAFVGAKGGVGSSTIAHNCAWGISSLFSTETILADLDLPFGTANIDFDQDPPQGMAEAVYSPDRLDEVFLDRLLSKCSEHLSLLAAPAMLDRTYELSRDGIRAGGRRGAAQCPGDGPRRAARLGRLDRGPDVGCRRDRRHRGSRSRQSPQREEPVRRPEEAASRTTVRRTSYSTRWACRSVPRSPRPTSASRWTWIRSP